MSDPSNPSSIDKELAKLEETCQRAAQAISSSRSVRETVELAAVDVPHHLKALASVKVPTLRRLERVRDLRIEEIVKDQLGSLMRERSDFVATREFDRLKANDWTVLRANYPDLYAKTLREANLILSRKHKG